MSKQVNRPSRREFITILPPAALTLAGCAAAPVQLHGSPVPLTRSLALRPANDRAALSSLQQTISFIWCKMPDKPSSMKSAWARKDMVSTGMATVHDKQEWPDWYPTKEILERKPEIRQAMIQLQGGLGMRGGPDNPLGARALYLWQGNTDTLYGIHGTNEPNTIGHDVSAGCIRLRNEDVVEYFMIARRLERRLSYLQHILLNRNKPLISAWTRHDAIRSLASAAIHLSSVSPDRFSGRA